MKSLHLSQPHALIMVGVPGSGKTFFAKKFADTFNAPFINLDHIVPHARDLSAAAELAQQQLTELLRTKQSIILELNTASRQSREELHKILRNSGYQPLLVWVQTDIETAKTRSHRDKTKGAAHFDGQIKRFSPPHANEKPVVISGKHTYATQAKSVLKRLSEPRTSLSTRSISPERSNHIIVR